MKETYKCEICGKTTEKINGEQPSCCGKPMKKEVSLDVCTQPAHAEHARSMDEDDACDDGRAG